MGSLLCCVIRPSPLWVAGQAPAGMRKPVTRSGAEGRSMLPIDDDHAAQLGHAARVPLRRAVAAQAGAEEHFLPVSRLLGRLAHGAVIVAVAVAREPHV